METADLLVVTGVIVIHAKCTTTTASPLAVLWTTLKALKVKQTLLAVVIFRFLLPNLQHSHIIRLNMVFIHYPASSSVAAKAPRIAHIKMLRLPNGPILPSF